MAQSLEGPHFEAVAVSGIRVVPFSSEMQPMEKLFSTTVPCSSTEIASAKTKLVAELIAWLSAKATSGNSVAWRIAPELAWASRYRDDGSVAVEVKLYVRAAFV